jgi:hypothetical protein
MSSRIDVDLLAELALDGAATIESTQERAAQDVDCRAEYHQQ